MNESGKAEVFQALRAVTVEILPELAAKDIRVTDRLRDLGANSVDRAEILTKTMAHLRIRMPLVELAAAENIDGLVEILSRQPRGR
jgi:polyketide biosynthesis acyl carrier protein